jgi:hypothetical protein
MRPLFASALLALLAGCAATEWVRVDGNRYQTVHADLASIRRSGDVITVVEIIDFARPGRNLGLTFSSAKAAVEYDCGRKLYRTLVFTWHSGNMAQGEVVYTSTDAAFNAKYGWDSGPSPWRAPRPLLLEGVSLELVCSRAGL